MAKKPVAELFANKFNECKDKVNEQMRRNSVVENAKRQIVDATRRHKHLQAYQLHALYYEAIHYLCFNLKAGEAEFYKALKKVLLRVEKQIDKKIMICALTEFWRNHPVEVAAPNMLNEYAARWQSDESDFFSLIGVVKYKPFWQYMLKYKFEEFNLENILKQSEDADVITRFEEIVSWIATDEDYIKVFFEAKFETFMEQIMQYVDYSVNYEKDAHIVVRVGEGMYQSLPQEDIGTSLTLETVFNTICNILPVYEIRMLNYMYLYYMEDENNRDYLSVNDFMYILNRMADYEYVTGEDVFCNTGLITYPNAAVAPDGSVDVVAAADDIIYRHYLQMEVAEIAWILENRFGVDESVINDTIARAAILEFTCGNLNDLVHNEKLAPLFQFPVAYNLFMIYFDDIVKNTAKYAFSELEEKYGIECKVVKA